MNNLLGIVGVAAILGLSTGEVSAQDIGVTLIADTQEHESRGAPDADLGRTSDAYVRVTLRPAQQTLFAKEVLKSVLANQSDPRNLIHLGDALDLSCRSEWQRFVAVMSTTQRPWVLAPGNHDGFAFGNKLPVDMEFSRKIGNLSRGGWDSLCDKGRYWPKVGQSFDKNEFIREYLGSLASRFSEFATIDRSRPAALECFERSKYLKCVAWRIDVGQPWSSYLVQLVAIESADGTPAYMFLLDTSNYAKEPKWAGKSASLLDVQFASVRAMREKLRMTKSEVVTFSGHHPLVDWDLASKRLLAEQVEEGGAFPFYVSAHTHHGWWMQQKINKTSTVVTELNVGSLTDAPVHYRTLSLSSSGPELAVTSARRIVDPAEQSCRDVVLPARKSPNSIEFQQPPPKWLAFLGYGSYWKSKRRELSAELFTMNELIAAHVSAQSSRKFDYSWDEGERHRRSFVSREQVLAEARLLEGIWQERDNARRIARFLIEADDYLSAGAVDKAALAGHETCLALLAAAKDAELGGENASKILERGDQIAATVTRGGRATDTARAR